MSEAMNGVENILIIGSGPAGIFTALELVKYNITNVHMVERGKDIEGRVCQGHELPEEARLY